MICSAALFFGVWVLEGVVSLSVSPSFDRHVPPVHNALIRNGPIPLQTLELRPLHHLELGHPSRRPVCLRMRLPARGTASASETPGKTPSNSSVHANVPRISSTKKSSGSAICWIRPCAPRRRWSRLQGRRSRARRYWLAPPLPSAKKMASPWWPCTSRPRRRWRRLPRRRCQAAAPLVGLALALGKEADVAFLEQESGAFREE